MQWIQISQGKDRYVCRADFIEEYSSDMELKINDKYWVFWSPNEKDTPSSFKRRHKIILHVDDEVLRKNKGVPVAGYYLSTLLMLRDTEKELIAAIDAKRVTAAAVKNAPKASPASSKTINPPAQRNARASKKLRSSAGKLNNQNVIEVREPDDPDELCDSEPKQPERWFDEDDNANATQVDGSSSEEDLFGNGGHSSSSDVPIQAFKDMEDKLKDTTHRLKSKQSEHQRKEKEMKQKLQAMEQQLKAKEDELRRSRENEEKLIGDCLRMAVHSKLNGTPEESPKLSGSNGEGSDMKDNEWNAMSEDNSNVSAAETSSTQASTPRSTPANAAGAINLPSSSGGTPLSSLSLKLIAKRKKLTDKSDKADRKKAKKPKSYLDLDFKKDMWEKEEWKLTEDQELALLSAVKKGSKHDSKLVKKALDLIYERETLAERSAKGVGAPSSKGPPRPECTPAKKRYILYLLNARVTAEAERKGKPKDDELLKRATFGTLEKFISSKISTVRRDLLKELNKPPSSDSSSDSDSD